MNWLSGIYPAVQSLIRTFSIYDIIDISVVSFLIYHLIKIIRESRAGQLVKGIVIILVAYFLSCQLHFRMLSTILSNFFQFSIFALLIVFQPELRRALEQLGRSDIRDYWSFRNSKTDEDSYTREYRNLINTTSDAVVSLCDEKMGALIVFERKTKLGEIIDTGTVIKSQPSVALICNIFFNKAPLHDGALVIRDGMLYAGGCILPLTKSDRLRRELGTRHRAAVGVSENSDAVAVVVSEETGKVSIAVNGTLKTYESMDFFKKDLEKLLIDYRVKKKYKSIFSSFRKAGKND